MEFRSITEPTFKNIFEANLATTTLDAETGASGYGLSDTLIFYVNGKEIRDEKIEPNMNLLVYLRTKLKLTGSKVNCDDGVCGSCTVMLSRWDMKHKKVINYSVNSSLVSVASLHGQAVTTIEGIASTSTNLHPLQERLLEFNGASCGICLPGVIMSMYTLLCNKQFPTMDDIEDALQGNTCRCGSYCSIINACKTFSTSAICNNEDIEENAQNDQETSKNVTETIPNIASNNENPFENIFPKLLLKQSKKGKFSKSLYFSSDTCTWYRPVSLKGLLNLKTKHPDAKLVCGNSKLGAEYHLDGEYMIMINVSKVKEMCEIHIENKGITIGASCTLNEIKDYFNNLMQKDPNNFQYQPLQAFNKVLQSYGGNQIRNIASLGGNIMAASPISELNAIWLANGCLVNVMRCGANQCRPVKMNSKFFTDYKKNCIAENEIVLSVYIPFTTKNQHLRVYKVSRRKTDDVSIVNAAMKVEFHPGSSTVKHFRVAYGGLSSTLIMPEVPMNQILGRDWQHTKLVDDMASWLRQEVQLKPDLPGGIPAYREALAISFFQKFYHDIKDRLHSQEILIDGTPKTELSSFQPLHNKLADFSCSRNWPQITDDEIGSCRPYKSGKLHVTGKSVFIDDLPIYEDELYISMVTSTRALAKIVKVDISAASKHSGFVDYIDKKDIKGSNLYGSDLKEEVFADEKVVRFGQIIGSVVANSHKHAVECAQLVTVTYEDIPNPVITIEDAIEHESYHKKLLLKQGSSIEEYESCDVKVESQFRVGPQLHFDPETQNCLVVPKEDEIEIYSSTQSPCQVQTQVSNILNISSNKICVKVKQLGGNYGGKDQNSLYAVNPTVVAATKLCKPIRCRFNRHDDMVITGSQSSFLAKYKIGAKTSGEIVSLILDLYSNAGISIGCSEEIMKRVILSIDNVYKIPNLQVTGYICKTNIASSTMSRGNGIPQALIIAEDIIEKLAIKLSVDSKKIREVNMYVDTDTSFCNLPLNGVNLLQCFDQCVVKSSYLTRKVQIDDFNRKNVHRKRGISCIVNKFGVLCEANQAASATVQINIDGSVLLSYSGIELGQGLHTKMQQIISKELGVSCDLININQTSTDTIPNPCTGFTTVSFDLNGMAVKNACETLAERLLVYRQDTTLSWQDVIREAHKNNVNLTASESSSQFVNDWNWNTETGELIGCPWLYAASGCSISEVELDCLTGEHIIIRTDIVIDAGKSLNPFIDISQVESAFMEGYGLFCLEEPLYSSTGCLLSTGSATYKIPSFGQCPLQLNIHLLNDSSNAKGIYNCKSVEEGSLALSMSIFFAIKETIKSYRKKSNLPNEFQLDSPVTVERARMSIGDRFTSQFQRHSSKKTSTLLPWNVAI